ncbi:NAD(P)/FAD-dependent oxidoreductase [Idiomarina xiamenensis]|uniref:NAD/FAD-binding protein n=1 Tax=Idiomarina xiamenensis 10-D-4 TaxID=740709 RepID=K2KFW9_9GAMM|nr:FAD-dependent oxidoreductase [Idiomarina xiamenensis]EKE86903.1 NAD/FAD-binding protein [Idiomarina xiamenensis 10-D-4]
MKQIAVIGSGISGLVCAHLLARRHQVSVFEKSEKIGGHTATVDINIAGQDYAVDTGFIVFNDRTYPNFKKLLSQLKVAWRDTEMSFSVTDPVSGLEYNGHNLNTLFAQRKNLFKASFYRLLSGILRFNKAAKAALAAGEDTDNRRLGDFLAQHDIDDDVADRYLLPMIAAIWSASLAEAKDFPLGFFLRFFDHHGLLNVADRPQWHTIVGGSRSYLPALTAGFSDNIHVNSDIRAIERNQQGALLTFADNRQQQFDEVILACHSDQALALLRYASASERQILGAIPYQANQVVLHTDASLLPQQRRAWASWNYLLHGDSQRPSSVTYNMNILQGIDAPETLCVTLNNSAMIAADKILAEFVYHHPVYSIESLAARGQREQICGQQHTHFCGAYWYNGFHEDGVRSAIDVAKRFGEQL